MPNMKVGIKRMTRLVKFLIVLGAIGAGAAVAEEVAYPTASWRYKMTVNVETPEGLKSGSAVREVTVKMAPNIQGLSGTRAFVKGEAVVVDLGKRGVLFALMKGFKNNHDHDYQVVFSAFPGPAGFTKEGLEYYSHLKDAQATLKTEDLPLMVACDDLNDPKTVKSVYEVTRDKISRPTYTVSADRFEEQFGDPSTQ